MNEQAENSLRFPLARDANGDPLDLPPSATAWRVRKLAARAGRPKLVYDNETGLPLEVPLTTTIQQLAESVRESGRFRLEAVDQAGRTIPNCVAVTAFQLAEEEEEERQSVEPSNINERFMQQLVEANTKMVEAMAARLAPIHVAAQETAAGPTMSAAPTTPTPTPSTGFSPGLAEMIPMIPQLLAQLGAIYQQMRAGAAAASPKTDAPKPNGAGPQA